MIQTIKRHWKLFAVAFSFYIVDAAMRSTSLIMEFQDRGEPLDIWKPFVWEYSSTIVAFILLPFILMFDERYPISSSSWRERLLLHIPLSMVFSFLHILGMVTVRKVIYFLAGEIYEFTDINYAILYEYRKDLMSYITILIVIYGYREILRLRQGEAQIEKSAVERIMVSKAGMFQFIDPKSVDWVEAAGNYVELHVGNENYMLRATMKEIEDRLGEQNFARVHRSSIVRRDYIDRIQPLANGDKTICLKDGTELRVSRRYNENLKLTG